MEKCENNRPLNTLIDGGAFVVLLESFAAYSVLRQTMEEQHTTLEAAHPADDRIAGAAALDADKTDITTPLHSHRQLRVALAKAGKRIRAENPNDLALPLLRRVLAEARVVAHSWEASGE